VPIITAIKPQKNKKRVNIYLDGKFAFGLNLENYVKLGLKVGQGLTEDEVEEIVIKAEFQKTLGKLLKFTTLRPRSKREVSGWLRRKKVHETIHKDLFNRLKRLDLIDDKKFARWWVEQRLTFRPRGTRALRSELYQKGIDRKIIDMVLKETDVDEVEIAKKLLNKKMYRFKKLKKLEAKKKMSEFLARKGFSWNVINAVLKDILD
jgi:regulatory protein